MLTLMGLKLSSSNVVEDVENYGWGKGSGKMDSEVN